MLLKVSSVLSLSLTIAAANFALVDSISFGASAFFVLRTNWKAFSLAEAVSGDVGLVNSATMSFSFLSMSAFWNLSRTTRMPASSADNPAVDAPNTLPVVIVATSAHPAKSTDFIGISVAK